MALPSQRPFTLRRSAPGCKRYRFLNTWFNTCFTGSVFLFFIVIHFYDLLSETFPGMKKKTQPLPVTAAAPPLTPSTPTSSQFLFHLKCK